jgi:uncharacterized protein (DUF2461 family)
MTDLRKAAEMALKTLDSLDLHDGQLWFSECDPEWFDSVTTALRQALAQPEQDHFRDATKKVEWVGLTDEERRAIGNGFENDNGHIPSWMSFARRIEAKLKEKNHGRI